MVIEAKSPHTIVDIEVGTRKPRCLPKVSGRTTLMRHSIFKEIYGVLVSEFQLTEMALAQPETFVAALT